jgi:hypothetical protein
MESRPVVFAFGDFEADEALRELRREGRPVELHATLPLLHLDQLAAALEEALAGRQALCSPSAVNGRRSAPLTAT